MGGEHDVCHYICNCSSALLHLCCSAQVSLVKVLPVFLLPVTNALAVLHSSPLDLICFTNTPTSSGSACSESRATVVELCFSSSAAEALVLLHTLLKNYVCGQQ